MLKSGVPARLASGGKEAAPDPAEGYADIIEQAEQSARYGSDGRAHPIVPSPCIAWHLAPPVEGWAAHTPSGQPIGRAAHTP